MTRRFLALGDSYTIGEGVSVGDRWPLQLVAAMKAAGCDIGAPRIVARTGWTTTELLATLNATHLRTDFDLVSLLIGVNDQYRGLGKGMFGAGFSVLLSRAVKYAGGKAARVIVISIPDWGATPFGASDPRGAAAIGAEIARFNALAAGKTRQARATFVDVTSVSRRGAQDRSLIAADGLHPSARMYAEWVQVILPVAMTVIERR